MNDYKFQGTTDVSNRQNQGQNMTQDQNQLQGRYLNQNQSQSQNQNPYPNQSLSQISGQTNVTSQYQNKNQSQHQSQYQNRNQGQYGNQYQNRNQGQYGNQYQSRFRSRRICQGCGAELEPESDICTYCGSRYVEPKPPLVVRRMPMIFIAVLTLGFVITSFFAEEAEMDLALIVSCVPGIVLLFLIYRMDRIEPEPLELLVKLFFGGALIATIVASIIEVALDSVISAFFGWTPIIYCFLQAFIMAAATEELCKYAVLKTFTWKHPAFNYRFDGIVYSTTVALGFEIFENLIYLIDNTAGTAFTRAAFPGHCIFGIYMGYYYGQSKALELKGDAAGASSLRRKGIITAIMIHGFYDFVCFMAGVVDSELIQVLLGLTLIAVMVVLNVTAYKNIQKYAYEDAPV